MLYIVLVIILTFEGCLCCLCLLGPLLVAIGVVIIAGAPGSTNSRNQKITEVNNAITVRYFHSDHNIDMAKWGH